jgi:hypothetical protein
MKNRKSIILLSISGCVVLSGLVLAFLFFNSSLLRNPFVPNIKDGGFLSGEPCSAPCFLGIIPNKTKETQAIQILKDNGFYKNCYIYNHESSSGLRGAVCSGGIVSVAYFRGTDIVGSIDFRPSQELTVEMVIEKYGEPNAVSVASIWFNWEKKPKTNMALIYDNINATVSLGDQEGDIFQIIPTTKVESIGYSDHRFPSIEEYEAWKSFLSSWQGYGEYRDVSNP